MANQNWPFFVITEAKKILYSHVQLLKDASQLVKTRLL